MRSPRCPSTRAVGSLLAQLQQQPTLWDRLQQGGLVGWVIVVLGTFGLLLALWRMIYLSQPSGLAAQMHDLSAPRNDNPLGRVIGVLGAKPQLADLETLELKLDEAILQETPPLEKGQGLLKLLGRRCTAARPAGHRDRHDRDLPGHHSRAVAAIRA